MQNNEYTVNDLVADPSFCRMVKGTASNEEIDRWDRWIEMNERNREKANQATIEITGFELRDPEYPDIEQEWSRLQDDTISQSIEVSARKYNFQKDHYLKWIYRIAAVLLVGLLAGMGTFIYNQSERSAAPVTQVTEKRTVRTGPDDKKTVKFSNGSKIILNSKSVITYAVGALHGQTIKVFLRGEAFFDAESTPDQTQPVFAVRTRDGIIRDIGTEFLVSTGKSRSRVVLQEGIVEISTKSLKNSNEKLTIHQGELLEFDGSKIISKEAVNATFLTAWATGFMEFNETPIRDFAEYVEQRFNVDVQVAGSDLADITLEGAIHFQSLTELVRAVSEVTQVPVYQSKDHRTVYIGNTINE